MIKRSPNRFTSYLVGVSLFAFTGSVANAISVDGSWSKSGTGGTLTVKVTGASGAYDKLQIQCKDGDVPANFTIGGDAGWSAETPPDFLITKGAKKYCVFKRSSTTTSDQTVTITTTTRRGGGGDISVGNGVDPKSEVTKTGESTLVSVGSCDLPGSDDCVCDISEVDCVDVHAGVFLGDVACPGGGACIPTVSEWGIAVMAMLVLTAGTIVVMRRRAIATN